jgi:glycosyltransferase involved in cell wall biosynthesis
LNRSLSVIWRVHNAQSWLPETTGQILDVVAELTDRFEILIMDDGSTDSTCDVASDLVRRYPQVRLLREPVQCGANLSIRHGLRESRGDVVIAHDGESVLDAQEIVRLWRSARSPAPAPKSLRFPSKTMKRSPLSVAAVIERGIEKTSSDAPTSSDGFQLLRPATSESPRRSLRHSANESYSRAPR